ncbi:MAG: hypothetical protein M3N54_16235 [Acidobacteriota bacterium]|nr:hypothetical protein [Acidobacteriota bacterium]
MLPGAINRPLNMEQLVRCLERRFGPVDLFADEGYTKLRVSGFPVTFLDAERLCLGEITLQELQAKAEPGH